MGDEFLDADVDKPLMVLSADGDWFKPVTLNLEATNIDFESMCTIFGFDGSKSKDHLGSVVIETTDTVSGAPPYPHMKDLDLEALPWWRILERRRVIAERERLVRDWEKAYAAWVADGRPDAEVLIRRYIPNAHVEIQED